MINNYEDIKHLKQFIILYNKCKSVNKLLKTNKESSIFKLKTSGDSIRIGCTKKLLNYLPQREGLYDFFAENSYFWIIPLECEPHKVWGYTLRGYHSKKYVEFKIPNVPATLFGLYDFKNFNFNKDYIILTEGIKDALVIKTLYPYTLALNTAGLTSNTLNLIKSLTNKIILIYDNDKAGRLAIKRDLISLKKEHIKAHSISLYYKDPGIYYEHPKDLEILNSNIKQYLG